jgi:histidyl-tRNA synthetase
MVRGLDYYERTTFEVVNPDLGAQDAICGGGRYDGLAEMLGSQERVPGVGFAAGLERIMLALEAAGGELEFEPLCEVALVHAGQQARRTMFTLCDVLRRAGVACTVDLTERSVKAQMRDANRHEALIALIAGDKDLKENIVTLKNLVDGEEEKIPLEKIVPVVMQQLDVMDETAVDEEPEDPSATDDGGSPGPGEAA